MTFRPNQYIIRESGKPVKGILQNKAYKVEYSSNRWVKLYGVPKRYSPKYFKASESGDILKRHMDSWMPLSREFQEPISNRMIELSHLAYAHKAQDFLIEAIMKGLIK
jgi:hypothetical protein